jgi:hypothetical protein
VRRGPITRVSCAKRGRNEGLTVFDGPIQPAEVSTFATVAVPDRDTGGPYWVKSPNPEVLPARWNVKLVPLESPMSKFPFLPA